MEMGGTTIIACEMMENEVKAAMACAGVSYPILWVERDLHNYPDRLRAELQSRVDSVAEGDTVLLSFAQCGNAIPGVVATHGRVVVPRFADCVHMLLSSEPGSPGDVDIRTLYTSRGFLDGKGLFHDYRRCLERYGEKKARRMCRLMVANYERLRLMDTGAYNLEECVPPSQELSDILGLEYGICPATIRVFVKLFSGDWDGEFIVSERGASFTQEQFMPI